MVDERTSPRRRFGGLAMGIVAAAAAVSVVAAVVIGGEPDVVERIRSADDVVVLDVAGSPFPTTQVVYSSEVGRVMFVGAGMPDPGADQTYQLWLLDDDGPRSAGTFEPDDGEATVVLEGTAETGWAVGLSVEPEGGSPQPTNELLFTQPLS